MDAISSSSVSLSLSLLDLEKNDASSPTAGTSSISQTTLKEATLNFLRTARELYRDDKVDDLNDLELQKVLIASKSHVGKALSSLGETLAWRKSFKVQGIVEEDFKDLEGKCQFFKRARDGSAVLVITGSRHVVPKDQAAREREIRNLIHVIEKGRSEGVLIDKMTVILDRANTPTTIDTSLVKTLIPILQKHYPERLTRMIVFPTSTLFWLSFKLVKSVLDPVTATKIELRDGASGLIGLIDAENLFERYGGICGDPFDAVSPATVVNSPTRSADVSPVSEDATATSPLSDTSTVVEDPPQTADEKIPSSLLGPAVDARDQEATSGSGQQRVRASSFRMNLGWASTPSSNRSATDRSSIQVAAGAGGPADTKGALHFEQIWRAPSEFELELSCFRMNGAH